MNNKGISNVRGGRFTINIISKILSNRRYIGEYRFRDIVVPNGIPPIIDKDLFDRVQASLEKNKHAFAKYKADDEYILTTKLYCGKCKRGCDKKTVKKEYIENAVVLYDDYALFYLNYKEHALKLKLSDIEKSSDTLLNALPAGGDILDVTAFSMRNCPKQSKIVLNLLLI